MTLELTQTLRLGTRGSLLARMQSEMIAEQVRALRPDMQVETVIIKTTGDRIQNKPLHDVGGKGLFTKELEQALLNGQIDLAVHSYKDVPVTMPLLDISSLVIAAVPVREDARDVLVTRNGVSHIAHLPTCATVGTGSLRRQAQLLATRPDLNVIPIRGNIDTRLRKVAQGELDAVILAAAGVKRAGLFERSIMSPIDLAAMVPSPGQGALALQCRSADVPTFATLKLLDDPATTDCVNLEREIVRLLNADCHSPLGAHAHVAKGDTHLMVAVAAYDGKPPLIFSTAHCRSSEAHTLADIIFTELQKRGAMDALHPPQSNRL